MPKESSMSLTEIWLDNLPIPPSANTMYDTTVRKVKKRNKAGKIYQGVITGKKCSLELEHFKLRCRSFKNVNHVLISQMRLQCLEWIKQGYILRVDTWFGFEHSRIWTKDGQPQRIDSDNRRKPMQDGLAEILDIDDKWFFSGNIEKVTSDSKELECGIIRIMPIKARTLKQIRLLRNTGAF